MEDKNKDLSVMPLGNTNYQASSSFGVAQSPVFDPQALSDTPVDWPSQLAPPAPDIREGKRIPWLKIFAYSGMVLLLLGTVGFAALNSSKRDNLSRVIKDIDNQYGTTVIPLEGIYVGPLDSLGAAKAVTINGTLTVKEGLIVAPSIRPENAQVGQIYFDTDNDMLTYYNGEDFVTLPADATQPAPQVGVLSLQGQSGDVNLAAGNGISISGTTIAFSGLIQGSLSVSGGLSLGTALPVGSGGIGTATLGANGVLIGNGAAAVTSVAAGGVGQCLLSTAGAPAWGVCSNGVASLNGLNGVLTLANASGAGSTITIDDATTATKGIASFNSTNFSVAGGAVNTTQDIDSSASPTFAGVNTNSVAPTAAFTLGATGQQFTLQGNAASTITSTSGGFTTTVGFVTPTANNAINFPNAGGTVCLQNSSACGFATGSGSAFVQDGNSFAATATLGTNDDNDLAFERNNITHVTVGNGNVALASNVDLLLQGATAYISNPQGLTNSEFFGSGATFELGSTANVTVVGAGSKAGDRSVSVGSSINNTANDSVAIGHAVNITSTSAIAIGSGSTAGSDAIAIGDGAAAGNASSIAIGFAATTSAANQLVIGSSDSTTHHISHVVVGDGVTSATPNGFTLQGTSGSGTDIAGASINIAGGQGTGTGNGGDINFQIAVPGATGSSLNSLATVFSLSGVSGEASFQNSANSITGFRVLNATSVPQFVLDTTNSRIYVGNPTADTAAALLVLDTKSDAEGALVGVNGAMYYNSNTNKFRCYEAGAWVNCISSGGDVGEIKMYAGSTAPAGWLLCDGTAVSRATYAPLFALVGTTYGAGDGSTTFNLPNCKGRNLIGRDAAQTEFDVIGETNGEKTHLLTTTEMPSHTHTVSGTAASAGAHTHQVPADNDAGYCAGCGVYSVHYGGGVGSVPQNTTSNGAHTHSVSGTAAATGGGTAHNVLDPYLVVNYIIKY